MLTAQIIGAISSVSLRRHSMRAISPLANACMSVSNCALCPSAIAIGRFLPFAVFAGIEVRQFVNVVPGLAAVFAGHSLVGGAAIGLKQAAGDVLRITERTMTDALLDVAFHLLSGENL